jgi:hypothetical protein
LKIESYGTVGTGYGNIDAALRQHGPLLSLGCQEISVLFQDSGHRRGDTHILCWCSDLPHSSQIVEMIVT